MRAHKCCNYAENKPSSRLLSVGRFGSGRGSVFRYSRYSMGSLRGEAPHNSRVGGAGGREAAALPPQEMQGGSGGGDAVPPVRSIMIISCRYRSVRYLFRLGRFCIKTLYETHLEGCKLPNDIWTCPD